MGNTQSRWRRQAQRPSNQQTNSAQQQQQQLPPPPQTQPQDPPRQLRTSAYSTRQSANQSQGQPSNYPAESAKSIYTSTVKNSVNVKRKSIKAETKNAKIRLAFTVDTSTPCAVHVHFLAREASDGRISGAQSNAPIVLATGLGQRIELADNDGLDLKANWTKLNSDTQSHSAIIRATSIRSTESEVPKPDAAFSSRNQSQTTYCGLKRSDEGHFYVDSTSQSIWVEGKSYELQEIYGIEDASAALGMPAQESGEAEGEPSSGQECVICLTKPRNTTVLPCRHLCMCSSCAKEMRQQLDKCPICRNQVTRLLEISLSGASS